MQAFERLGRLPVSQARAMIKSERGPPVPVPSTGRPRNYVYRLNDQANDIVTIITRLTPEQWKQKGGTRAFWQAIQKIGHSRDHQDRLKEDLD
jgi:hypothetical protein